MAGQDLMQHRSRASISPSSTPISIHCSTSDKDRPAATATFSTSNELPMHAAVAKSVRVSSCSALQSQVQQVEDVLRDALLLNARQVPGPFAAAIVKRNEALVAQEMQKLRHV